jgi:phosphate transport system protein
MAAMRSGLSREEAEARDRIICMSHAVEQAIEQALRCFREHDAELAGALIGGDTAINAQQRSIEEGCFSAIALQQPVAGDLRDLVSDMYIAAELERIADHAADIAKIVLQMDTRPSAPFAEAIDRLGQACRDMLGRVLVAYGNRDETAAREVAADDEGVDRVEKQITADLLAHLGQHPDQIRPCTHALWVAHNLERIGDRVTNIAERIVFMVSGRHVDLNR